MENQASTKQRTKCPKANGYRRESERNAGPHFINDSRPAIIKISFGNDQQNSFQRFWESMLTTMAKKISSYSVSSQESGACAMLSLTSPPSTNIVIGEGDDSLTVHIWCQKEEGSAKVSEWICRVAERSGFEIVGSGEHETNSYKTWVRCLEKLENVFKSLKEVMSCCMSAELNKNVYEGNVSGKENDQYLMSEKKSKSPNSYSDQSAVQFPDQRSFITNEKPFDASTIRNPISPGGASISFFMLLLKHIAMSLTFEDVTKLKKWIAKVDQEMELEGKGQLQILRDLHERDVINPLKLQELKFFFEDILRFDLVHLVDSFVDGDYTLLKDRSRPGTSSMGNESPVILCNQINCSMTFHDYPEFASKPEINGGNGKHSLVNVTTTQKDLGLDAKVARAQVKGAGANGNSGNFGSNAQKLSKPQKSETDEGPWLCNHYKRRCYVKFNCCEKYWPCHRCHNNNGNCGKTKLKSRDTSFIKCTKCGTEQKFTENSQFCIKCHLKFAEYFCAPCKHLTGKDDVPYHCRKCGICRIHGDRSFHCDVCGVCLDKKLQNNHKCRAGSAHDECCICLEDAFTGCQILPCSHKVHKDCATLMIRSGIKNCPICRESFAHRLEKRPLPPSTPKGQRQ